MIRKILDWAGYGGLVLLAAALILPFARPDWLRIRPWLVGVGSVLVVLSLLVYLRQARATISGRTARYGFNTALTILLLLGVVPPQCAA